MSKSSENKPSQIPMLKNGHGDRERTYEEVSNLTPSFKYRENK